MPTRTAPLKHPSLTAALPHAPFTEAHHRIVDAPATAVWDALHTLRWGDLTLTRPLFGIRTLGRKNTALDLTRRLMDPPGPGAPVHEEQPRYSTSAMIGRPWAGRVRGPEVTDLDQFAAYADPGWLKYGMDWTLTDLAGGRTLIETTTRCQPTDAAAHRAFRAYWAVIRPFSGLIRLDILRAIARRVEAVE